MTSQQIGDLISREDTLTAFADYVGSGMSMDDYDALYDIVLKMPRKDRSVQDFVDKCRECGREKALDKIRAEIEHIGKATPLIGINTVIEIIDKYKAESEEV